MTMRGLPSFLCVESCGLGQDKGTDLSPDSGVNPAEFLTLSGFPAAPTFSANQEDRPPAFPYNSPTASESHACNSLLNR